MDMPTEAEEIWRYSRIGSMDLGRYSPLAPGPAQEPPTMSDLPIEVRRLVEACGATATVVLSRNGGPVEVLGPQPGVHAGVPAHALAGEEHEQPSMLAGPDTDIWTVLNSAFVHTPLKVTVEQGAALHAPVVVVHSLDGEGAALFPRLEVEIGANASATVLEVLWSPADALLAVPLTQLSVGPGAQLSYAQVQLLGPAAWQLANQVSRVDRDARLRSMTVAFGGDYARVRTDSVLEGAGADSELLAVYFGAAHQEHDLRTIQHHAAPRSRSDLLFKGAVAGSAKSVYSGLIRVEKGAKGTNAFQTNRNLVLSEGAEAYSVPNLEIEDNDVRCSHASAVGPIDESQLFYLESRGVPTRAAERLIALGFMDEVIGRFPVSSVRPLLRHELAARLDKVVMQDEAE